jgi:adenylyl-sulfate kinase
MLLGANLAIGKRMNQQLKGFTLWLTGLPCSGKSTLAQLVAHELVRRGHEVEVLDGDEIRKYLSKTLGFSRADRDDNIRRIGFVSGLLSKHGVVAIAAAVSPYRATRVEVRGFTERFFEVYVKASVETCIQRDVKGMYRRALDGQIANFTGISDPYEPPLHAELVVDTENESPSASAAKILVSLEELGLITLPTKRCARGHKSEIPAKS